MSTDRFVILGLARARTPWYSELSQWATSGMAPIEFIKCLSAQEVRARVSAGRAISALVVDAAATGLDRDLIDDVTAAGCAVLVVSDPRIERDWIGLGASTVLPSPFDRTALVDALRQHAGTIRPTDSQFAAGALISAADNGGGMHGTGQIGWLGDLIVVMGAGGVGASTIAMASAQSLASRPGFAGSIALVDASLRGDMAMFHDVGDVIPGLLELVEAHRHARPNRDGVRSMFFDISERGYHLLLGLRRRRDWTALRARAFDAAIASVRTTYETVIADIDDDLDGTDTTGSADMDDRNLAARNLTRTADLVIVVGLPGTKGVHGIVRGVGDLVAHGVHASHIAVIVNRAPRSSRAKNELSKAIIELLGPTLDGAELALAPVFVPEVQRVEASHRQALRLPERLVAPVGAAIRVGVRNAAPRHVHEPAHIDVDDPSPVMAAS